MSSILISIKRGKVFKIFVEDLRNACPADKANSPFQKIKMPIESDEEEADNAVKKKDPIYCSIPYCTEQDLKDRKCDFKLFVSWLGSDKNHKKLISTSERFMVFEHYNLEELFSSVLDIAKPDSRRSQDAALDSETAKKQFEELEDEVKTRFKTVVPVEFERAKTLSEI